jgi:prenyltransferase beta subunit
MSLASPSMTERRLGVYLQAVVEAWQAAPWPSPALAADRELLWSRRGIETILSFQHPSGGFAGGPGQLPHLLPTYAAVCSLAMLGGGWDRIDREGLRAFFSRMKRGDGGFTVCHGGEVDVRSVHRALPPECFSPRRHGD